MANIEIYTKDYCPFCTRAKELLRSKGRRYTELSLSQHHELQNIMEIRSGQKTVPQIFINSRHIGGCDDMFALDRKGELDPILNAED